MATAAEDPTQPSLAKTTDKMKEQEKESYLSALRTVYWIATEEVPNRKYKSLLGLLRSLNVKEIISLNRGGNSKKESPQVFNEMLAALAKVGLL